MSSDRWRLFLAGWAAGGPRVAARALLVGQILNTAQAHDDLRAAEARAHAARQEAVQARTELDRVHAHLPSPALVAKARRVRQAREAQERRSGDAPSR